MLRASLYQQSLLEVDPDEINLALDGFERQLRDLIPRLFSVDDFRDLHPSTEGAPTCCPLVLVAMLLLQFRFDVSDRVLNERCTRDLGWRYAIGLKRGEFPPSTTTVARFRSALRRVKGDSFVLDRVLEYARKQGFIDDVALQAMDSTNTDCRGAIVDTFNLVATAIGLVVRRVAAALGEDRGALATRWNLCRYLARSVKGAAAIDWSDERQRNKLLTEEIADADRVRHLVSELSVTLPPDVVDAVELLAKVARQDVEQLANGTWRIAHGTAKGRVISISDPDAGHGRKSASSLFNGFKTHIVGTIKSLFITGIAITSAGTHDAKAAPGLIDQAAERDLKPDEALADAAYGTGENLRACATRGVAVHTKMPTASTKTAIPKRDFVVDLDEMTVTCPQGHTATNPTFRNDPAGGADPVARFKFDKGTCSACPLKAKCSADTAKGGGRSIILSAYERELQRTKAFNATKAAKPLLRSRSAVERLISHLVRMGMRHARFFGMHMVQFQAYMTAAAYDLQRIITLSAKEA